jgi:hypothetical protein
MQTVLSAIVTHNGADGQESSVEADYQAASGAGYDQDCDGNYDSSTDVYPFIASSSDPFGGGGGEFYDPSLADAGTRGGFGFREYSLPIIVHVCDTYFRDPESSSPYLAAVPGGCPIDAGRSDFVAAFADLNAYFAGIDASGGGPKSSYGPYNDMILSAQLTNSYADLDGDGDADDELVAVADQSAMGYDTALTEFVVTAVDQLVQSIRFTSVELNIEGDEYGFVTDIDPDAYTDIDPNAGTELDFTLTFRGVVAATTEDQLYRLTLNVIGDGTTLLDSQDIIVLVPGTSYDE